jgi:tetratricopeptide (TPR) repeat protein
MQSKHSKVRAQYRDQVQHSQTLLLPEALEENNDPKLQARIGRAYVCTHDYHKAIEFYEAAVSKSPNSVELCADLAKLLTKLERYAKKSCISLHRAITRLGLSQHQGC